MTFEFSAIYFICLLFIHLALLSIILYNFFTAYRLTTKSALNKHEPFLSVLIPARNEENNIGHCLDCLVNSSYKNLEIKVLDDASTDQTFKIISEFQKKYPNIELITGEPLPSDWLGKNWACYQLSKVAHGDLLLFLDADVRITNQAINSSVHTFLDKKVKMLSVFPTQIIKSFGEWLVVPLMDWLLLTFLPLKKIYTSTKTSLAAANGQFLMFDRKMYFKLGGHQAVCHKIVEDMEFVRIFKSSGAKVITLLGNDLVKCRMYVSLRSAVRGFTKNFFSGFNTTIATFIMILLLLSLIFILPIFIVLFENSYILIVILIISQIVFTSLLSRQNILLRIVLFFPQMILLLFIGVKSLIAFKERTIEWKDRIIK